MSSRIITALILVLFLSACSAIFPDMRNLSQENGTARSVFPWEIISGGIEGDKWSGFAEFRLIRPVAVAARGNDVYIVDAGNDQLYYYDRVRSNLTLFKDLRTVVKGEVTDLFLATDLSLYLADADAGRVLHFDRDGNLIRVFHDPVNLGRPVAVSVDDASGYVYIADGFNDDVLIYNAAGRLQGAIGTRGDENGEFRGVTGMSQGPEGFYVATRFGRHRVQVMAESGVYKSSFQKDTLTFPLAIAVDDSGLSFVADYHDNSIKVYQGDRLLETIGGSGAGPGRFKRITDLWLDDGLLYVADSLNGRVQVLRVVHDAVSEVSETQEVPETPEVPAQ